MRISNDLVWLNFNNILAGQYIFCFYNVPLHACFIWCEQKIMRLLIGIDSIAHLDKEKFTIQMTEICWNEIGKSVPVRTDWINHFIALGLYPFAMLHLQYYVTHLILSVSHLAFLNIPKTNFAHIVTNRIWLGCRSRSSAISQFCIKTESIIYISLC